jgi:hypothetical protein
MHLALPVFIVVTHGSLQQLAGFDLQKCTRILQK